MTNIRRRIASLPPVKALRVKKWERNAARYLLSPRLCAAAEQDTSLRHRLIRDRLARFAAPRETAAAAQALGLPPETAEDVLWWQISRGYSLNEYLCYGFAEKTPCERRAFISDRESVLLSYRLNDLDAMAVFSDKARTFAAFGARYGRDVIAPETADDYGAFLRFIGKHPVFLVKPRGGSCGKGIEKIDAACGKDSRALFEALLRRGPVVLEEPIRQSGRMAALHPASVNTVRVLTLCGGGRVLFRRCFLKIGRAGVLTDNGAAGGIMAGIDPAAGAVCTDGVDETGARYTRHPDSGVTIPGFVLPAWDALTALCDALSLSVPAVRWIGWDAAHTDAGWVIVEGNAQSELIGPQAVAQAGLRAELAAALRRLERPIDIIN